MPDHINANGEAIQIAASSMIRSHSVSGDLHGVPPDPIAADILRKEPEHETFARLNISPTGIDSLMCATLGLYVIGLHHNFYYRFIHHFHHILCLKALSCACVQSFHLVLHLAIYLMKNSNIRNIPKIHFCTIY